MRHEVKTAPHTGNPFCCARKSGVAGRYAASIFDFGRLNPELGDRSDLDRLAAIDPDTFAHVAPLPDRLFVDRSSTGAMAALAAVRSAVDADGGLAALVRTCLETRIGGIVLVGDRQAAARPPSTSSARAPSRRCARGARRISRSARCSSR